MAPKTTRRRTIRSVVERIVSVGLIVVPLVVIAVWLAVHHKPGWYRPVELDARGMQHARRHALSMADSISDQMVRRDAFEVVLSDESVTHWIAALGSIWPEAAAKIPSEITDIVVAFDEGVVRIGGRYRGSWQAIVSAGLEVGITEHDSNPLAGLWIHVLGVYAGSLPIPSSMIERLLIDRHGDVDSTAGWIESASDHADGSPTDRGRTEIENRFVWFNGRRPYRILSIQVADGELRVRIEPL